ncbi:hypothetical protein [Agromyces sp. NPDC058126]|uniref:hypothetical protein n=1 Tax=Agromyces sp. NPDC058126 TaxID=3346350 RepID=UPI0036DBDB85
MVAKPRVHEIASAHRVNSKIALRLLKDMGEYVRGPSSSIQAPVAHRLSTALHAAGYPRVERQPAEPAVTLPRVTAGAAASLLEELPSAMPELLALLLDGLQRSAPQIGAAIGAATKHRYFAMFKPLPSSPFTGGELDLPRPSGVALFLTAEQRWGARLLSWSHTSEHAVAFTRLGLIRIGEGRNAKLRITSHEEEHTGAVNGSLRGPRARRSPLIDDIRAVCRREYDLDDRERPHGREIGSVQHGGSSSDRARPDVSVVHVAARSERGSGEKDGAAHPREVQWMVQGHWRRQWYPSSQEHRPIWISEHRAGHSDASLLVRDRVYVYGD